VIELDGARAPLARFARELVVPAAVGPHLSDHGDEAREAARVTWSARIIDEYRSVPVFAELLHLLADLEAPFAALCAVQQLLGDELRHTHLCAEVASWLGGHADLDLDLADIGLPPRGDHGKARRALDIIGRELVVGEEESIAVLAAYRDATDEPAIRDALATLLRDEVRHAATGRALLRLFDGGPLSRTITPHERRNLDATMAADRADLRARYLASALDGPGRALGASLRPTDLR
jgi:hypothetical protein